MRTVFLVLLTAVLAACSSPPKVSSELRDQAAVAKWQRWAWQSKASGYGPDGERINRDIRAGIEQRLAALGYEKTSKDSADFLVDYAVSSSWQAEPPSRHELDPARVEQLITGQPISNDPEYQVRETGEGILQLYFTEPGDTLVWRGSVEQRLDYRGQGMKKLPSLLRRVMADFPPRQ